MNHQSDQELLEQLISQVQWLEHSTSKQKLAAIDDLILYRSVEKTGIDAHIYA